jgi:hypothetical protein
MCYVSVVLNHVYYMVDCMHTSYRVLLLLNKINLLINECHLLVPLSFNHHESACNCPQTVI